MEREQHIFKTFLAMHSKNTAPLSWERCVHAQFYRAAGGIPSDSEPLLIMDQQDILDDLDPESPLVRWLLEQLRTYHPTKQKIIALIFDKKTVLSDVFWVTREIDRL
jgi:hypothetical protein